MNLTNLNRDCTHIKTLYGTGKITWNTTAGKVMTSGVVQDHIATLATSAASTVSGDRVAVLMPAVNTEATPYRVKIHSNKEIYLTLSYAPATITAELSLSEVLNIPAGIHVDEIIQLPYLDSSETYAGRALMIGVTAYEIGTSVYMSVQDLSKAPPPFSMGVS